MQIRLFRFEFMFVVLRAGRLAYSGSPAPHR
jgi:hypothetical protein